VLVTADEADQLQVISVDRASGKTIWSRSVPRQRNEYKNPLNHGASSSAATDGTDVYAFFGDYGLVSYDARGRERWKTPVEPLSSLWGTATSPVLAGDTVVLLLDGFVRSSIMGFDRRTGRKKWETERRPLALNYSTPLVRREAKGACEVLAAGPNELAGYDPANGKQLWSTEALPGTLIASPILDESNTVFAMSFAAPSRPAFPDKNADGEVTEADIPTDPADWQNARIYRMVAREAGNRDGTITAEEWKNFWAPLEGISAVSATRIEAKAGVRWRYSKGVARVATPVIVDRVLYYVNMGGILTALDAESGTMLKTGRLEGALDNYYASPVGADGLIYFASESGKIVVVKAGGADWQVLAVNDLDEACFATPALSQGRIFVRTSQSLACFGA
jgi:outer membrane protein assembly factor BamB